ncbi:MAG: hypothetical protein SFX73_00085 [Kofleriaceae bacterium]|nr:hypothetical protein [Kofleriaceae bacterium]
MKLVIPFVVALFTACASAGPRPVNVATIRNQISGVIRAESSDRTITSMGKVSNERAVVYTTGPTGGRQEETWVKSGDAWKLEKSEKVVTN